MEATTLSLGKSVLDGALGYAKSAVAEEVALQLGVQRDQAFIRDELQMMQAFLMAAHEERGERHMVLMIWVKQVRDIAYDAEDNLQDFSIHLKKPSWWHLPRTLRERRRIAMQMKDLRARVEDVSQRNQRYQLIKSGAGSMPATATEQSSVTSAAIFNIDETRHAAKQEKSKLDLDHLINEEGKDLRVIAVWGTSGGLGQTSIIRAAYERQHVKGKFPCQAWVRVVYPFNPRDFVQSLLKQFNSHIGVDALLDMDKTWQELAAEFSGLVNEKSYLVVLNDLSTIEEWDRIKICFPNNKNGSRIIVSTSQVEVASLCAGQEGLVSELKLLSADQTIYAFYEKVSQDGTELTKKMRISDAATTSTNNFMALTDEITENQSEGANEKNNQKILTRVKTLAYALEESKLIGREKEKSDIIKLISNQDSQQLPVISVWGMGGLGKTTLIKEVYQSQELSGMFEKRACVTVMRPFVLEELLRSLALQLDAESPEKKSVMDFSGIKRKPLVLPIGELRTELSKLFETNRCLIILDDISSTAEWDLIIRSFDGMHIGSRIIITTRERNIAKHCADKHGNIYMLKGLEHEDALDLFKKKVFGKITCLDQQYPELAEEAKSILKKCKGLPLAIVTIGGFLAKQPKIPMEWRKLNEHIGVEMDMNQELGTIKDVLIKSYDGLPYHLKSCFLYMSIFPEDHNISRRRLVHRWIAEGYSSEVRGKSLKDISESYFMELIDRSMILPFQESIGSRKGIDSCQVHDLMREISIMRSMEENLVFRMEEGCSLNTLGTVRHLTVSSTWEGDQSEFESAVDLSRIRSLTVFGNWKPFFISDKMRLLRVLDLEDTPGLVDHHLEQIGKLLHLKYLSLRGCADIFHLPDSLGKLKQLQTLDITDTRIFMLPQSTIKLRKLQYIRAGGHDIFDTNSYEKFIEHASSLLKNKLCMGTFMSMLSCVACCNHKIREQILLQTDGGETSRRDVCTFLCHVAMPFVVRLVDPYGVVVPRGLRKLKSLHTLGVVNIARGKSTLQEIKCLTQLRKLVVIGIERKNCQEFCSILAHLSCLESLSVRSVVEPGLCGCLDAVSSPPKNLQSLKLLGNLVKLPEWMRGLQNLVKLKLEGTKLSDWDATVQVLGKLPNLAILRLMRRSFEGEELRLIFQWKAFPSLMLLQLHRPGNLKSVEFIQGATPKLELLWFSSWFLGAAGSFSGLASLPSLKEFMLDNRSYMEGFVTDMAAQLAANPNAPILKRY